RGQTRPPDEPDRSGAGAGERDGVEPDGHVRPGRGAVAPARPDHPGLARDGYADRGDQDRLRSRRTRPRRHHGQAEPLRASGGLREARPVLSRGRLAAVGGLVLFVAAYLYTSSYSNHYLPSIAR